MGCDFANKKREVAEGLEHRCAFCRETVPDTEKDFFKNVKKRVKKNDPAALYQMGERHHREGDYETSLKYLTKAAELGYANAHYDLSIMYREGNGVEKDMKKEVYHTEEAAMKGHPLARHNLGCFEALNGRFQRAKKHFIIGANLGHHDSLKCVMKLYADGHASKEDYAGALRAYQAAVNATKSLEREEAEAYYKAVQHS